jgi:hypothetical protein
MIEIRTAWPVNRHCHTRGGFLPEMAGPHPLNFSLLDITAFRKIYLNDEGATGVLYYERLLPGISET